MKLTDEQKKRMEELAAQKIPLPRSPDSIKELSYIWFVEGFTAALEMQSEELAQLQQEVDEQEKEIEEQEKEIRDLIKLSFNHTRTINVYKADEEVKRKELAAIQEQLARAEEALRFYADERMWRFEDSQSEVRDTIASDDLNCDEKMFPRGGKRAREYFKAKG